MKLKCIFYKTKWLGTTVGVCSSTEIGSIVVCFTGCVFFNWKTASSQCYTVATVDLLYTRT